MQQSLALFRTCPADRVPGSIHALVEKPSLGAAKPAPVLQVFALMAI